MNYYSFIAISEAERGTRYQLEGSPRALIPIIPLAREHCDRYPRVSADGGASGLYGLQNDAFIEEEAKKTNRPRETV